MAENDHNQLLYPADISEILEDFGHLLAVYDKLKDQSSIFGSYRRTNKRLEVTFPLKEHPVHGITGLTAIEKYDEAGYIERYSYTWRRLLPKQGIQTSHITSWGNDPHDASWTPTAYQVITEPHHHHYDPADRKKRRENYNVRTLRQAFTFVGAYIESGKEYAAETIESLDSV
ncbi:hypothetical protein JOD82_002213 [Paenibacillus sp. 1182]|uniref:toxin-antitoxin system TumE family protein n=1 Tax=Paenibacillus sp. 1182 TaxID=2806565 RepID=UPI001AE91234|nr:DUF6516 family protein [Paenibacillus sp. 1182]MBP1309193.1 hypothetical protein [Paenibacillus sp. 1182]